DVLCLRAGCPGLLEYHAEGSRISDSVSDLGDRGTRGLHGSGLLPVLCLLGGNASADVLPDRHLGGTTERIRSDQILSVYPAGWGADADCNADVLFQQRSVGDFGPRKRLRSAHTDEDRRSGAILTNDAD